MPFFFFSGEGPKGWAINKDLEDHFIFGNSISYKKIFLVSIYFKSNLDKEGFDFFIKKKEGKKKKKKKRGLGSLRIITNFRINLNQQREKR